MEPPICEEREANTMLIYITVTTPILVFIIAVFILAVLGPQDPMDLRGRDIVLFFAPAIVVGGPLAMAAMWHMALSRQPFKIFPDRIEPTYRTARLGLRGRRHSINLAEVSTCDIYDVSDSWGRPAFRHFELTLTRGRHATVIVPDSLGAQAEAYLVATLKRVGVRVETHAMSMSAWVTEWRRIRAERRRTRIANGRSPPT